VVWLEGVLILMFVLAVLEEVGESILTSSFPFRGLKNPYMLSHMATLTIEHSYNADYI